MSASTTKSIRCGLCPKTCLIPAGHTGECKVRVNVGGELQALTYGRPCAVHVDPMEKKPLFHYCPGAPILSLGSTGCNFHCKHCQNADISQANPEDLAGFELMPHALPALAERHGCRHVAYTYNEPLIGYEYVRDCCIAARSAGLRNVLVSNGYINPKPLAALAPYLDAANIDIKGFSPAFYREVCDGTLEPVLRTVKQLRAAGVHVEITNLVIPTLNDTDEMLDALCAWMRDEAGPEMPLHVSRFFPQFRMVHLPPTPIATLLRARERARLAGLKHVYVGNAEVPDGEVTCCAGCGERLVVRQRYVVTENRVKSDGACPQCGKRAYGVWA